MGITERKISQTYAIIRERLEDIACEVSPDEAYMFQLTCYLRALEGQCGDCEGLIIEAGKDGTPTLDCQEGHDIIVMHGGADSDEPTCHDRTPLY